MGAMEKPNAKHVDFGFLKGMFPNPRELPVNVDMMMEKGNSFIVGEWKKPKETLSKGQEIMLMNLARRDKMIVLIIEGSSDDTECYVNKVEQMHKNGSLEELGRGTEFLKNLMKAWHAYACSQRNK
jgi:hypothetical protein